MKILGIDIGGTGIKGAPVDTDTGVMMGERFRIPTPEGGKPKAVSEVVGEVARHFEWSGLIGCGFPAAVRGGTVLNAANLSKKWIGSNAAGLFSEQTNCTVHVLNDADAAGLAEMTFGAGRGRKGVVLIITIGTGLGTSLFTDGVLLPNVEMGHIEMGGKDAETQASEAARVRNELNWPEWTSVFNRYLQAMEHLLWPDLIILGGGAIKKQDKFFSQLKVGTEIVPAQFLNEAGIIGAALGAHLRMT
ncbi:MAG TPA: ROK family protein [Anaerolineales bacterium]|nr:ROK family protein [Anaerolineales bacterium]